MTIGVVSARRLGTDVLLRTLALRPEHHVLWVANSGPEAIECCRSSGTPDLILMDLVEGMDVVDATRRVMESAPCAILLVTASVRVNAGRVFEAMGHGALDVVEMPAAAATGSGDGAEQLLAKLAVISRLLGKTDRLHRASAAASRTGLPPVLHPLVAIGASAGGPAALAELLRRLPKDFPAAIVVVQHVEAQFAAGLAHWLGQQSSLPVTLAKEGQRPSIGTVLLAGTNDHLVLTAASKLSYTPEPRDYVYRPSVDVFFETVSRVWRGPAVGVLLTGMGRDGAQGLKALRDRGYHTIAQDHASCAVYGMPKAAAALNAAVEILPLLRIAPRLIREVERLNHSLACAMP
jgi:two-component system, chemotaxis family, response regulator WspF